MLTITASVCRRSLVLLIKAVSNLGAVQGIDLCVQDRLRGSFAWTDVIFAVFCFRFFYTDEYLSNRRPICIMKLDKRK